MQEATCEGAVLEVDLMDVHEEAVDHLIGPIAVHPQRHLVAAVGQRLVRPAGGDKAKWIHIKEDSG